jgi:tRNA-specific 2-thiouridylase
VSFPRIALVRQIFADFSQVFAIGAVLSWFSRGLCAASPDEAIRARAAGDTFPPDVRLANSYNVATEEPELAKVVLAMSGGVDSSVAAHLLLRAGHEVVGVFMRHGAATTAAACATQTASASATGVAQLPIVGERLGHKQGCCTASDAEDARRVADRLEIPFYAIDFQEEFGQIIDYFVAEYTQARTPNPCVMCNNWLKFGRLFDYADSVDAEFVATGHYARLQAIAGERTPALCRGVDDGKDQSYVLFGIDRALLPRMLLPVGDYNKPAIRAMAGEVGLRVADKRDSQEICFVPDGDHAAFIRRRRGELSTAGELVTVEGRVVGEHDGIEGFTIGQRKGLGVAFGEPRFVVRIEPETNRVVIGTKADLARHELTAGRTNWLVDRPDQSFGCQVKIRYNSRRVPATVTPLENNRLHVRFDVPQIGVAPGQAVVCYDGDRVLGGGWIA